MSDHEGVTRREFLKLIAQWGIVLSSLGILVETLPGCGYQNDASIKTNSSDSPTAPIVLPDGFFHAGGYYY